MAHLFEATTPTSGNFRWIDETLQRINGRSEHIVRVARTKAFRQDIVDPGGLENGTHSTTGDHAGTLAGRPQQHLASTVMAHNAVRNRAIDDRDRKHRVAGSLVTLPNRLRNLIGLAEPEADTAVAVTDDDQRAEAEAAPTLHNLRNAIDADDLVDQLAFAFFESRQCQSSNPAVVAAKSPGQFGRGVVHRPAASVNRYRRYRESNALASRFGSAAPLETKAAFPSTFGHSLHSAVVDETVAVEDDRLDVAGSALLSDQLPNEGRQL